MTTTSSSKETHLLRIQSLSAHRGIKVVLQGLNYSIPARGIHVIMGPGGAGKSTFLQALCDPLKLSLSAKVSGEVFYQGERLGERGFPELVAQQDSSYRGSAQELLEEGRLDIAQFLKNKQLGRLDELCAHYGFPDLGKRLGKRVTDLERFERRVIVILKAILKDPALVCLDEPLSGFQGEVAERIIDFIRQLGRERSVILITHHHIRAEALGDTVTLLTGSRFEGHSNAMHFFKGANNHIIKNFVKTGGSSVPNPSAVIDHGAVYWTPEEISLPRDPTFPLPLPPPPPPVYKNMAWKELVLESNERWKHGR